MTHHPLSSVCSQSSRESMNNTPATLSLFTRELELNSVGKLGRMLMEVIAETGLTTLQASHPTELAQLLQEATPEMDEISGQYLEAASKDPRLATLAIVAATPAVTNVVRRSIGFMVNMEFESELSVCVLERLKEVGTQPTALRRQWLACASVSAARKATRIRTVSQCQMVGIEEALEVVDVPSSDLDLHLRMEALNGALESEVISVVEAHVIRMTRVEGVEFAELARALNLPDATLRKRRRMAELRLRDALSEIDALVRQD